MEAIILAGGKGTRLKSVIKNIPKPMAPINNRPFIGYLFLWLKRQNIRHIILSVGFKYRSILNYYCEKYEDIMLTYSIEKEALGTGGGIKNAFAHCSVEDIIVMNGDTFFNIDLNELVNYHHEKSSDITIALKPIFNSNRYDSVELNFEDRIVNFNKMNIDTHCLINAGIYVLKKKKCMEIFSNFNIFSFEQDILQTHLINMRIFGKIFNEYFIDIGIPEDYMKAQTELPKKFDNQLIK